MERTYGDRWHASHNSRTRATFRIVKEDTSGNEWKLYTQRTLITRGHDTAVWCIYAFYGACLTAKGRYFSNMYVPYVHAAYRIALDNALLRQTATCIRRWLLKNQMSRIVFVIPLLAVRRCLETRKRLRSGLPQKIELTMGVIWKRGSPMSDTRHKFTYSIALHVDLPGYENGLGKSTRARFRRAIL